MTEVLRADGRASCPPPRATPCSPGPPGCPARPRGPRRGGAHRRARRARPAGRGRPARPSERWTSRSPPACWSATDRCCGSVTRSPAARSSRRSARTPPPGSTAASWPSSSASGQRRRRPAGPPRRGRARRATAVVRHARRAGDRSAAAGVAPRGRRAVPTGAALRRPTTIRSCGPSCSTCSADELATLDQWADRSEAWRSRSRCGTADGVPLREGDALRRLIGRLLAHRAADPESDSAAERALAAPRAARAVARARLGAGAVGGRRVHGQRARHDLARAPRWRAWDLAEALGSRRRRQRRPQHPGVRRRTTADASGSHGSGRRWPWPSPAPTDPGRPRLRRTCRAARSIAMRYPEAERLLPRGARLLRRARHGAPSASAWRVARPRCWPRPAAGPRSRTIAARAAGRRRVLADQPGHVPGRRWASRGRGAGCRRRVGVARRGREVGATASASRRTRQCAVARAEARWLAGDHEVAARAGLRSRPTEADSRARTERSPCTPCAAGGSPASVGPRSSDLPPPYAAELRATSTRPSGSGTRSAAVRRRHGPARLVRRAGPARGARPVRRPGCRARSRDGPQEAARPGRPGRAGRCPSRDPRPPPRAHRSRAGGAGPARRGPQRPGHRRPAGASRPAPSTTTSPRCWPSSASPTGRRPPPRPSASRAAV